MEPIDKAQENRNLAAESLRLSRIKDRKPLERDLDLRLAKTYKNLAESREYLQEADAEAARRKDEKIIPLAKLDAANDV